MWDIKHKSGTLLFTTHDESVADNRRTMGWVVEMKKLTVEKAQELIEQLSQGERSCREEYYLQALEAFVGEQWIACSDRMPDVGQKVLIRIPVCNQFTIENGQYAGDEQFIGAWCSMRGKGRAYKVTHWCALRGAPL